MYGVETINIVSVLGGDKHLGRKIKDSMAFDDLIREGFTLAAGNYLKGMMKLTDKEFANVLGISQRTLGRKKSKKERLSLIASDRLYRLARIFAFAVEVLGDKKQAREWLHRPQIALGGRVPLEVMKTEAGAQEVEDLLGRIEHGVVL